MEALRVARFSRFVIGYGREGMVDLKTAALFFV
jgi:hypothetical protein